MKHDLTITMGLVTICMVVFGTDLCMAQSNSPSSATASKSLDVQAKSPALPQPRNTPVAPGECAKVTLVEWSPESDKPSEAFAARVGALKDKPLRAADLLDLTTNFTRYSTGPGVKIKAAKDDKSTGVCLSFTLLAHHARQYWDWQLDERVQLGPQTIYTNRVSANPGESPRGSASDFMDAVQKATTAPPDTPFEINMEIRALAAD